MVTCNGLSRSVTAIRRHINFYYRAKQKSFQNEFKVS